MADLDEEPLERELMRDCFAAQKRTGSRKQFVFYCDEEFIYKGPYDQKVVDKIIARSRLMKKWQTPYIVHPDSTIDDNDKVWILYEDISKDYPITEWEDYDEAFSGYKYRIAKRTVVDKLSYQILNNQWVYSDVNLLEGYLHLYLLGVGDVGLHNTLIDTDKNLLYLIDYDENRTREHDSSTFYFSKPPAKRLQWYEKVGYHYREVAQRLEKIKSLSPEYSERIDYAISLLNKYAIGEQLLDQNDLFPVKKANVAILGDIGPPLTRTVEKEKQEKTRDIGKMSPGAFNGTTYSGLSISVAKSALQKYIRRSNYKALYAAFELYRMLEIGGKGNFTNFINRLKVIAIEDAGPSANNVVLATLELLNSTPVPSPEQINGIVRELLAVEKTRIVSHINTVYNRPWGIAYARKKHNLQIDEQPREKDLAFVKENRNDPLVASLDDETLVEYALIFYKRLLDKNYNAVRWLGKYSDYVHYNNIQFPARDNYHDGNKWRRVGGKSPILLLWKFMDRLYDNYALNILRWAYFDKAKGEVKPTKEKLHPKRSDSKYFITYAVAIIILNIPYQRIKLPESSEDLSNLLNGGYQFGMEQIDDYVLDIHTAQDKGKGKQYFLEVSSMVDPEDMNFHIDAFVDTYINSDQWYNSGK